MRTTSPALFLLLPALAGTAGCKEYFSVDEACHPDGDFRGKKVMGANEAAATDRINCYRRLTQLERFGTTKEIYDASSGVANYVLQNPELFRDFDVLDYANQQTSKPGFTGTDVYERFDNAQYSPITTSGTKIHELFVMTGDLETSMVADINESMTHHIVQGHFLAPSAIDFSISEVILDSNWWNTAYESGQWAERFGLTPADIPTEGRFYYAVAVAEAQPFEHTNEPIALPKRDQTDAATHWGFNPAYYQDPVTDELKEVALGPSLFMAYVSPTSGAAATGTATGAVTAADNPYGMSVENASLHGPNGPIETLIVNPGGEVEEGWLSFSRTGYLGAGIYPKEPLQPNTEYTFYYDMTTVDGPMSDSWSFKTGVGNDPGTSASGTSARLAGPPASPAAAAAVPFLRGGQLVRSVVTAER